MIETIDSDSLATKLNKVWKSAEPLKVMLQINTSNEARKPL